MPRNLIHQRLLGELPEVQELSWDEFASEFEAQALQFAETEVIDNLDEPT